MRQFTIGDVTIDAICERSGPWRTPETIFLGYDREASESKLRELGPVLYDAAQNRLVMAYHSFVLRWPGRTVLIDTCTGEDKGYPPPMDFPKQPWLDGLAALDLAFEDIDVVFSTHLHIDHCGWNTRLREGRWVPAFPRARYLFVRGEYEYWKQATARGENPPGKVWTMNCEPVMAAGQGELVEADYTLDGVMSLKLTPGHSPFHCCVDISSRGEHASVVGDLMHHALQLVEPDTSTVFCADPKAAARSRRAFLAEAAEKNTLLFPSHFPGPVAGRVQAEGKGFRWQFA